VTTDAGQHVPLFFALCTKNHALLPELVAAYVRVVAQPAVKAVFHAHVPGLIATIGCAAAPLPRCSGITKDCCTDVLLFRL